MFRHDLSSIPERNEEEPQIKWVPKKKHEVLKAKYKCLKKLFQIYDASVIGIIPEPIEYTDDTTKRRRKRSHRTKTDACAGTTETLYSADITQEECESIATESQDLKIKHSCSTQIETSKFENASIESLTSKSEITSNSETTTDFCETKYSKECVSEKCIHDLHNIPQHLLPYVMVNNRRKLTRFQSFVQRIFGIRQNAYIIPNNAFAASDSFQYRRRGLRYRRLRKTKKIKSDSDIKEMKSSAILSYVQSVQKSCLLDTTPRQCPMVGCKMMSYGIINYNDHLNLCHLKDRKYICHYCHEGFEKENDKFIHENEHIGLNKLGTNLSNLSNRQKLANNSNTQTEPTIPDEKLKKIVSFIDKISNSDEIITEIRKNRSSETNLTNTSATNSQNSSEKRTMSCMNIGKCKCDSTPRIVTSQQYGPTVTCRVGENLQYRRYLSLHSDLGHQNRSRFSKFCNGIPRRTRRDLVSEDGRLNVRSIDSDSVTETAYSVSPTQSELKLTQGKSDVSLTCDPSTNIVYCTSLESMKRPSPVESLLKKVQNYKWEPGTKVIHV